MKILADENIPFATSAFGTLGEVSTLPGRKMSRESVKGADILLVRSVTRIDAALLEGAGVRFVATATIGTDHVDESYLKDRGIGFASAPGSNSNSVMEYVIAALLVVFERSGRLLEGSSIAVIGVGNVGSKVAGCARSLGMRVMLNDPPLARKTGDPAYRPLDEVTGCDVVTFHVPLTREGADRTLHLADAGLLDRMSDGALLINSSRGAVTETGPLCEALRTGRMRTVIDVWEGEPDISMDLLERADIATPHIAGYSFDGKVNATEMIYRSACRFFGVKPSWKASEEMPRPEVPCVPIDCTGKTEEEALGEAVLAVYDIRRDDADLRNILSLPAKERPIRFDRLRKEYSQRREFFNSKVTLKNASGGVKRKLEALGFAVGN